MTSRIANRSKKRAKQERQYSKLRKEYLDSHLICEVEGCGCDASDIHHRKSRAGEWLNKTEFWMAVCRPHHLYIEDHSKEAYEKGWKLLRSA